MSLCLCLSVCVSVCLSVSLCLCVCVSAPLPAVEAEAREMQETCLEKARTAKEEVERMSSGRHSLSLFRSHGHGALLSAERLLMSEALDMVSVGSLACGR